MTHVRRTLALAAACLAGMTFWAVLGHAGPLDPPAGPVASSYKTLTEVEPRIPCTNATTPGDVISVFRINSPGSYYLTGNVTGTGTKNGILIDSDHVTLDLNGFTVQGPGNSATGILVVNGHSFTTIRNGSIRGWGLGVDLNSTFTSKGTLVENIMVTACGSWGIRGGTDGLIRGCIAVGNAQYGIVVFQDSAAEDCVSKQNSIGFGVGPNCSVRRCESRINSTFGYVMSGASQVDSCLAVSNGDAGFEVEANSNGETIRNCEALNNTKDGIVVSSETTIVNNICSGNGLGAGVGAGIHVAAFRSHIEHNQITRNDQGILLTGSAASNFIVGNTCSGHAAGQSYVLVNTNTVGPIVTATGTITSTSPFANFEY